MIQYKDKIFLEYFIDPITADITNSKGEVQETKIKYGRPVFKSMEIHRIQVHTHYGWKQGMDIHHLDENKMNNSLSNLVYLTRSEHTKLHSNGKILSEETRRKISEAKKEEHYPKKRREKLVIHKKVKMATCLENTIQKKLREKLVSHLKENHQVTKEKDISGLIIALKKNTSHLMKTFLKDLSEDD